MKKLSGTTLMCFIALLSQAQQSIHSIYGRAYDAKSKESLMGATVSCKSQSVQTDKDGNYILPKVFVNGNYEVTVSYVGYTKQTQKITIKDNDVSLNFELQKSTTQLENLEVTSIRANDKSPFAKTNLSKEEIATLNQGQDLPFTLNQTPNVVVNTDAGNGVGYTGIRIRGSDATRINVTMNGIPFNDAESHGSYFVDLPDILSSASSIQIQRGVGTSSNGTGAFGATINLATNELNKTTGAEINSSYGSFSTFKNTIKANSGLINNRFTVDARLSQVTSDGYIDRAKSDLNSFAISGAYIGDKSSLRMNIFSGKEKTYQAWNGIDEATLGSNRTFNVSGTDKPGEPYKNETDNYTQTHYQLFYNKTININWSYNVAGFYTRGIGYYENYLANQKYTKYGTTNPSFSRTDLVRQLWLDNDFYGSIFSAQYKKKNNILTVGGSYTNYNGRHYGYIIWADKGGFDSEKRYYNLKANKWDRSFYVKMQHQLNNEFSVYADLQYRFIEHDMPGFRKNVNLFVNRKFDFFNPKVGVTYQNKNLQAYFSYANASKEPNRDDFETELTNQPKAEHLHDFELGFSTKEKEYSLGINAYYMLYKDQLIVTGKLNDVGANNRINVDNSYRMGIEITGNWNINKWIQFSGNVALSQNKIQSYKQYFDAYDTSWNPLPDQKDSIFNNTTIALSPGIVSSNILNFIINPDFNVQLVGKYVGRQYLDNTQTESRSLKGFYTEDVRLFYTLKNKLFSQTTFILSVNNIFNTMYVPIGNSYPSVVGNTIYDGNYYFPAAGTNFMFSVNVKL